MTATYAQVADYAGWLDLTEWGVVRVYGADRQRFLQTQTTNDLRPLTPGTGVHTAFCTPTGHLLSDAVVLERGEDYLLILPPETFGAITQRLSEAIILDDVMLMPLQEGLGLLSLQGTRAEEVLEELGLEAPPAGELRHAVRLWQSAEITCIRHDRTGFGGIDLLVPYPVMEEFKTALIATECLPIPETLWEVLRYEAGIPRYGIDMDERTLAPEMDKPFEQSHISYTKGCYTGQEVLMRIHARGHTNRTWVPMRIEGESRPPRGTHLSAEERPDAGWITGAVISPALGGAVLAWGFVRNAYIAPDTRLIVEYDARPQAVVLPNAPRPARR